MSAKLTNAQVSILFSRIAALDSRKTTKEAIEAFGAALMPTTPQDAMAAVDRHRAQSNEWLMPSHLNEIMRAWRAERLRMQPAPIPPDELGTDARRFIAWEKHCVELIADGVPTLDAEARVDALFKIVRTPLLKGRVNLPELRSVPE